MPIIIHAGDLNRRIRFEARAAVTDERGQAAGSWAPVARAWAKMTAPSARDIAGAGQMQAVLDCRFVVRYREDVLPTWRVVLESTGEVFDIVGRPMPLDGGRQWLAINCCSGVRDGR